LYYNTVAPEMRVYNGSSWTFIGSGAAAGVESFNTRTGAVTLTSSDVTTALTYTPLAPAAIGTTVQAYDADLTTLGAGGSSARSFLGLAIGTDVQAYDAQLADIAGLTPTDNSFIVGNGTNFVAEGASTARTSLGLGTAATTASTDYATAAQGTKADNALTVANPSYTGTLTGGTGVVNIGSGQVYKDADGNVGIGTTSPTSIAGYKSVTSNGTTSGLFSVQVNGTDAGYLYADSTSFSMDSKATTPNLVFKSNGSERMRIDSSGNVGVGTASPSTYGKLAIAGTLATVADNNGYALFAGRYNSGFDFATLNTAASTTGWDFQINGTSALRIASDGNVGIGTSSPQCDLDLGQTGSAWVRGFGMYLEDHDGSLGKQFRVYNYGETFGVSRHTASTSLGTYETDVLKIAADGTFAFNSGYGSAATAYGCRAWVNFNGTANTNLTGTYSQTGTTVTVTITGHGYITGSIAYLDFTSGTAVDGAYTVTVTDANTFTVTQASRTTSGNVTDRRSTIRGSGNVSSVSDNTTGDYTVNFITAMPDANYSVSGSAGNISRGLVFMNQGATPYTTSGFIVRLNNISNAAEDGLVISAAVFR
jgi:hypothetical protein